MRLDAPGLDHTVDRRRHGRVFHLQIVLVIRRLIGNLRILCAVLCLLHRLLGDKTISKERLGTA